MTACEEIRVLFTILKGENIQNEDGMFTFGGGGIEDRVNTVETYLDNFIDLSTGRCKRYIGDLNDITENCVLNVDNNASTTANYPSGSSSGWGFLITFIHAFGANYRLQVWFDMDTTAQKIYKRHRNNSGWKAWEQIYPTS